MKRLTTALLLAAWATLPRAVLASDEPMRLIAFEEPPYQTFHQREDGSTYISGHSVQTIRCIVGRMGYAHKVSLVPRRRARMLLSTQAVDGFFAVDSSPTLDLFAQQTQPISLEKWLIFTTGEKRPIQQLKIGSVLGSNEESWLLRQGFSVELSVRTVSQLFDLLDLGRINAILMDERVFALAGKGRSHAGYFLRYAPLHAYFSNRFLEQNPGFLQRFNERIPQCVNKQFRLNDEEREAVEGLARDLFQQMATYYPPSQAIAEAVAFDSMTELLRMDKEWRESSPDRPTPLALQILNLPASAALDAWQAKQEGLVTETMIVTQRGVLAAISQLTSDYWQGDEFKFLDVYGSQPGTIALSNVAFDASTGRFQIFASQSVAAGNPAGPGVAILGIDIEQALLNINRWHQGGPISQANTNAQNSEKSLTTTSGL